MSTEAKEQLKELLGQLKPEELKEVVSSLTPKRQTSKRGRWSQEEIQFLEEFAPENGVDYVAEQLGRTVQSVKTKWGTLHKSTKKTNRSNEFLHYQPVGKEKRILDKDKEIDKILSKNRPTERLTRPTSLVKVRCRNCGDTFRVGKALVQNPKRFRCNDCITGRR